MGLYKICEHDRNAAGEKPKAMRKRLLKWTQCPCAWHGSFRGQKVSLSRWTNREIGPDDRDAADAALGELKAAVRAGTFDKRGLQPTRERGPLTFAALVTDYAKHHIKPRHIAKRRYADPAEREQAADRAAANFVKWTAKRALAWFGHKPITEIRKADVDDYRADLNQPSRVNRQDGLVLSVASVNRELAFLRHLFNWAVGREYLERTPFKRGSERTIALASEKNFRRKRIVSEDEEIRLLAAASPILRALIVFAVDTGARRGEMLALTWDNVNMDAGRITFHWTTTKSENTREVRINTQRLRDALNWLRPRAKSAEHPDTAAVFCNEVGEPIGSFRTAWVNTVLRAHGIAPKRAKNGRLTADSKAALRRINLHWHDLRHTYGTRLTAKGVPLSQVRDLMGHASITTTERYDNQTQEALDAAAGKLETGATFTPHPASTTPVVVVPTTTTVQ
jgi:integrase